VDKVGCHNDLWISIEASERDGDDPDQPLRRKNSEECWLDDWEGIRKKPDFSQRTREMGHPGPASGIVFSRLRFHPPTVKMWTFAAI
jgi:hypothetical protein